MTRKLIVIPARYGSTRFPGKPLALIDGIPMINRTAQIAIDVCKRIDNCSYVVATDDIRIYDHCYAHNINCMPSPNTLQSGSDRVHYAASFKEADQIINLQGDAPFTPVSMVTNLINRHKTGDVATPCVPLSWEKLAAFKNHTTVVTDPSLRAIWFSKNVIPRVRDDYYKYGQYSPVLAHVGLYSFTRHALDVFSRSAQTTYEKVEGLEQLRMLECGLTIQCVKMIYDDIHRVHGVNTQADIDEYLSTR